MSCTKTIGAVVVAITCSGATTHYSSGCALLKHYDTDNDGKLTAANITQAGADYNDGLITNEEVIFVNAAYLNTANQLINEACPGCFTASSSVTFNGAPTWETPTSSASRIIANITITGGPVTLHSIVDGVSYVNSNLTAGTYNVAVCDAVATNVSHQVTITEANAC